MSITRTRLHLRRRPTLESLEGRALLSAGDLDPTFGIGGLTSTAVTTSGGDGAWAVLIQSDGKIVAGGDAGGQTKMGLARYNANGTLDTAFGSGGTVANKAGQGIRDLALQTDGKIVAAGFDKQGFVVARFKANGSADNAFGSSGKVSVTAAGSVASGVALQPDGKIVAVGSKSSATSTDFSIARFTAAGSLDTSFGVGGVVTTDFIGYGDYAREAVIQADGKILVAGTSSYSGRFNGPYNQFALARYNANGTLDTTFDGDGKLVVNLRNTAFVPPEITGVQTEVKGMVLQPDGKAVVAINAAWGGANRMTLARFNTNGSLDSSFGVGGVAMFDTPSGEGITRSLALRPDGKIVVVGSGLRQVVGNLVAVVNPNGTLDPSFGGTGMIFTSLATGGAYAVALQADGKIVVVGQTNGPGGVSQFLAARYEGPATQQLSSIRAGAATGALSARSAIETATLPPSALASPLSVVLPSASSTRPRGPRLSPSRRV